MSQESILGVLQFGIITKDPMALMDAYKGWNPGGFGKIINPTGDGFGEYL